MGNVKSVKLCGRLFCCFWAVCHHSGREGSSQRTGFPRHRWWHSPGGKPRVTPWHHLPSLPLQLTLRWGHCARSMALPNALSCPGDKDTACPQALPGAHCCPDSYSRETSQQGTPPGWFQNQHLTPALTWQNFFFFFSSATSDFMENIRS